MRKILTFLLITLLTTSIFAQNSRRVYRRKALTTVDSLTATLIKVDSLIERTSGHGVSIGSNLQTWQDVTINQEVGETLMVDGDVIIRDTGDLGSESFADGSDFSQATWTAGAEFTVAATDVVYLYVATGAGLLTQTSGNMTIAGVGSRWYKLVYTISGSNVVNASAAITATFASALTYLDLTDGAHTKYFQSAAAPANFVIAVGSATAGETFEIESMSLKEIQGGDLVVHGLITGGGTAGIKVLSDGKVGIGTTTPSSQTDILKAAIGVTQSDAYGLRLSNTTAASTGAQQYSPPITWQGNGWKTDATAASQTVEFMSYVRPVQGAAAPTGGLDFLASINGGAYSATPIMTMLSNGNVGIGLSPVTPLGVKGSSFPVYEFIRVTGEITATRSVGRIILESSGDMVDGFGPNLLFGCTDTGVDNVYFGSLGAIRDGSDTEGALIFKTGTNGDEEFLRIDNAGNVGIGTTVPLKILDVVGSQRIAGSGTVTLTGTIDPTASTTVDGVNTLFLTELVVGDQLVVSTENRTVTAIASNVQCTVDAAFTDQVNDETPDKIESSFYVTDNAGTNPFVIDADGNVGIGTASPANPLHILSTSTQMQISYDATGNTDQTIGAVASGNLELKSDRTIDLTASREIVLNAADNRGLRINTLENDVDITASWNSGVALFIEGSSGNVGIGTTAPATKFEQAQFSADALGSGHTFSKSRHATAGSHTVVADDDVIGFTNYAPSDGTDFGTISAKIHAEVDDAAPTGSSIGGALVFSTAIGVGADDLTERMRIGADGNVKFAANSTIHSGNSSTGIKFSGSGNTVGLTSFGDISLNIYDGGAYTNAITVKATSKNVGIGTTAPATKFEQAQFSADALGSGHTFSKSRHATAGSHTVVVDDDVIGFTNYAPSDGTDFGTISARIHAEVDDAAPTGSSIGGAWVVSTARGSGADDLTETARFTASGNLDVAGTITGNVFINESAIVGLNTGDGTDADQNLITINRSSLDHTITWDESDSEIEISVALAVAGILSGETGVTLDVDPTITLTAPMCKNAARFNNDADVIDYTLPAAEAGLVVLFYDIGGGVITIDPFDGTDTIYLNGTSVGAGDAIDSPGNIGDFIALMAIDDTRWISLGRNGTFVDGGVD